MKRYAKTIHATYSEIIDLQTVSGKTTIIGIHTPQGDRPVRRLSGLFKNFLQYRYNGCSLKMVPAANLPVDPLGLTGIPGTTNLMDPRDLLNPIISHGCHGESLSYVLNSIYRSTERIMGNGVPSDPSFDNNEIWNGHVAPSVNSVDVPNAGNSALDEYYNCLTDQSWKKWGIQSGVSLRNLHPLVHRLGLNHPMVPVWYSSTMNGVDGSGRLVDQKVYVDATGKDISVEDNGTDPELSRPSGIMVNPLEGGFYNQGVLTNVSSDMQMMTSGMMRLGWLPTSTTSSDGSTKVTFLPKIFMSVLILPPSYNVEQFFRMIITHRFSFRGFSTSLGFESTTGGQGTGSNGNSYFNWIDYTTTSKAAEGLSMIDEGTSLDIIDGHSEVVADGVR